MFDGFDRLFNWSNKFMKAVKFPRTSSKLDTNKTDVLKIHGNGYYHLFRKLDFNSTLSKPSKISLTTCRVLKMWVKGRTTSR